LTKAATPSGERVSSPEGIEATTFSLSALRAARFSAVFCSFSETYDVSSAVA
jgi:hypothetical protein